jgi:cell division protein FtsB
MSKIKVLTAVFLGTLSYVLVSLFGGQDGLWAERQLRAEQRRIGLRTAEIQGVNTELRLEYEALKGDPEVIASFARKLGYVADGEKLVKINGLPVTAQKVYNAGIALKRGDAHCIPEWICKIVGICIFALTLCFFALKSLKDFLENEGEEHKQENAVPSAGG